MDAFKQHLRRLAVHDDALLNALAADGASTTWAIDEKTAALVRVAATIAVDAAPSSFQHAITQALAAGATRDEIVASLEAVTPVTGTARVVQGASKVALALGYDVDAALERHDSEQLHVDFRSSSHAAAAALPSRALQSASSNPTISAVWLTINM